MSSNTSTTTGRTESREHVLIQQGRFYTHSPISSPPRAKPKTDKRLCFASLYRSLKILLLAGSTHVDRKNSQQRKPNPDQTTCYQTEKRTKLGMRHGPNPSAPIHLPSPTSMQPIHPVHPSQDPVRHAAYHSQAPRAKNAQQCRVSHRHYHARRGAPHP